MIESAISVRGSVNSTVNVKGKTNTAVMTEYPELENLEIDPSIEEQIFTPEMVYGFNEVRAKKVTSAIDPNIDSKNIKAGSVILGVEGDTNVVDTSDANVSSGYMLPNYSAYSKGQKIEGSMKQANSSNPHSFEGSYKVVNPEDPYFILRYQYAGGTVKGEILKIKSSCIDKSWIEGKNICLRCNLESSGLYRFELIVTDWGNRFQFFYGNNQMYFYCKDAVTKESKPCEFYYVHTKDPNSLTVASWTKSASTTFGKIGDKVYAYSRDESIPSGSHEGSNGVPGVANKIVLQKSVGVNSLAAYVPRSGEYYEFVPQSTIASAINLQAEDIREGATVLGITGTHKGGNEAEREELLAKIQELEEEKIRLSGLLDNLNGEVI